MTSMMRMQQEAAERVQRMQEQSRRLVREYPVGTDEKQKPPSEESSSLGGLAALLQGDQEQTLVLLLAVILAKNGAPLELVLALLYVAM